MIHVRPAEMDDRAWILEQLRAFGTFYGMKKPLFPADTEYATVFVDRLISTGVFFVAEKERWNDGFGPVGSDMEPVGFIAGMLGPHPFDPELRMLTEMFWWVMLKHRGSRAGAMLFRAFDTYGHRYADAITLSQIEGKSPLSADSLEKRGYHLHERSYLKEIEPCEVGC